MALPPLWHFLFLFFSVGSIIKYMNFEMLTECLIIMIPPSLWKISGFLSFVAAGRSEIS